MGLKKKKFIKRNEGFICDHCHKEVLPLINGFCRNHCPFCLYSKHVDVNPGDRDQECKGMMKPIRIEQEGKRGQIVIHECRLCKQTRKNQLCLDDPRQPDSMDTVLEIMKKYVESV